MPRRLALAVVVVAILALIAWLAFRDGPTSNTPAAPPPMSDAAPPEKPAPRDRARHAEPAPSAAAQPSAAAPATQGPTISGRVIDADGAPVVGARAVAHPDDLGRFETSKAGADGSRTFSAKSGADGAFEVRVDPKTIQAILTVEADAGFGQVAARPKDRDVVVKLSKWTLLAGKVTDVAKKPIAGAKVTAHLLLDALIEDHETVSDADGNYRIERLPPIGWSPDLPFVGRGRHGWVVAEADGYAPLLAELESRGVVPAKVADTKAFDIVLVRGMTLTGKVVDGDTKAPISGATVVCWSVEGMTSFGGAGGAYLSNPWGPRPLGETKSGDDGSFRFEHLPAQGPSGVASHNSGRRGQTLGHVAAWKEGYVFGGDEIPVSKDEATVETTIELWPPATITGRVVDQDSKPVEGAAVYVNVDARRPAVNGFARFYDEYKKLDVATDADGRYALSTFRASRSGPTTGKLGAGASRDRQWTSSAQIDVTANAGETVAAPDLVIDFGAVPRATIVVIDGAGAPVAGATVERGDGGFGGSLRTGLDGCVAWSGRSAPKPDAPIAATSVVVRAKGFASQKVEFTPTLKSSLDVKVEMKPGARIAGRVVKADGGAGARATILVADGTKTPDEAFGDGSFQAQMNRQGKFLVYAQTTAEADGNFKVVDLPDGPYLVAAQMSSRAPAAFNTQPNQLRDFRTYVAAGATDLLLTIPSDDAPPTQPLEVSVTDGAGVTVEQASASAAIAGAKFIARRTDASTLLFDALPAGVGTVSARAPGWAPTTHEVRIDAGSPPPRLVVQLSRGVKLHGSLRSDAGALPSGCSFVVSPVGDSAVMGDGSGNVGADDAFEIGGLSPGRWRLLVRGPDGASGRSYVPVDGTFTIPDGRDDVAVDLTLTRAGSISLRVSDPRLPANPYGGVAADPAKEKFGAASRLEIADGAGVVVWTQSPVYGYLGWATAVPPGDYVVRLALAGESAQEQRCTVKAGESAAASFPAK